MSMSPQMTTNRSSGSEASGPEFAMDQRRQKRRLSNRESARRSRIRKQQQLDELVNEVAQLKNDNSRILMQANAIAEQYVRIESENTVLRAQMAELSDRLQSVNEVLRVVEEFSGVQMDIPEMMQDPMLHPWQLPCPSLPIMAASADMLQY